jgi:hypothetical protein
MGLFDSIGNWASNKVIDPMRSINRSWSMANPGAQASEAMNPGSLVQKGVDVLSGAGATQTALDQQMAGGLQAQGAMTDAYNQSRGILNPYMQGGAQDYQSLRTGVQSGAFNPQFQQYQGQMSSGNQAPQFQGYQGQMSSGVQAPQYQGYQGPMSSGAQGPQFQQYQGQMSSGSSLPQYQGYQGPTSSGQSNIPQYQQFQGANMPQRQQATAENVNMFMDPGYQFRMDQGLGALENRMAGRGLVGSGAEQKGIMDYAQGLASQEYGNAFNRFQQGQENMMGDARDTRNFGYGMNQDQNSWNASNADRAQANFVGDRAFGYGMNQDANSWNAANSDRGQARFEGDRAAGMQNTQMNNNNQAANTYGLNAAQFQQGAFEGDRAAGLSQNQFQNNYGMQGTQFNQGAFEGDRAAGMGYNQYQNNWNATQGQTQYNMANGLAGMGFDAAGMGANLATGYGQNLGNLYQNMANMQGLATMTQSNQRRGLFGDAINLGTRFLG